jgi:hypothetical protein
LSSSGLCSEKRLRMNIIRGRIAVAAVAFLLIFVTGVNLSPAFADSVSGIPGVSAIVKILQFERGKTAGGEITDGKQIGPVDWEAGDTEKIFIPTYQEGEPAVSPSYFEVVYRPYPYSVMVEINGIRSIFGGGELPGFEGSRLVEEMYRIVTYDDQAQRFVITFKKPVEIKVKELSGPAGILIEVKEAAVTDALPAIYSVRTASYENWNVPGTWEEIIRSFDYESETVRQLRDSTGKYFVEAGYFSSNSEAEAFRKQLLDYEEIDFNLYIEHRGPGEIPVEIKE